MILFKIHPVIFLQIMDGLSRSLPILQAVPENDFPRIIGIKILLLQSVGQKSRDIFQRHIQSESQQKNSFSGYRRFGQPSFRQSGKPGRSLMKRPGRIGLPEALHQDLPVFMKRDRRIIPCSAKSSENIPAQIISEGYHLHVVLQAVIDHIRVIIFTQSVFNEPGQSALPDSGEIRRM